MFRILYLLVGTKYNYHSLREDLIQPPLVQGVVRLFGGLTFQAIMHLTFSVYGPHSGTARQVSPGESIRAGENSRG